MSIFSELKASCPGLIPDAVEGPALTKEPLSALEKMGLFGEHLIRCILAFEGLNEPDAATQIARLNMLSNRGFLPLMLLPFFHVLNTKDRTSGIPHTSLQMRLALVLKIAERLSIWFAKSYIPHLPVDAKRAQDVDGVIKSIRENPPSDQVRRSARRSATRRANTMQLSEGETRVIIDFQLRAAGWQADSLTLRYSQGSRPEKGVNKAIAEWQTGSGPADYALFAGLDFVGVVEAKKMGRDVIADLTQSKRYSKGASLDGQARFVGGPWEEYRVPFLFSTNARPLSGPTQGKIRHMVPGCPSSHQSPPSATGLVFCRRASRRPPTGHPGGT